jgi:hypothetical protein
MLIQMGIKKTKPIQSQHRKRKMSVSIWLENERKKIKKTNKYRRIEIKCLKGKRKEMKSEKRIRSGEMV